VERLFAEDFEDVVDGLFHSRFGMAGFYIKANGDERLKMGRCRNLELRKSGSRGS